MTCKDREDWTVSFPNVQGSSGDPATFRPDEVTIKQKAGKLDYCRLTFQPAVGENLKPHTRHPEDVLGGRRAMDVKKGDRIVRRFMFTPDNVRFGSDRTHIKGLDQQKVLDAGNINTSRYFKSIKAVYRMLYTFRDGNGMLNGLVFGFDDQEELATDEATWYGAKLHSYQETTESTINGTVDGGTYVDFEGMTPLECMWDLNKSFGLRTWVDNDGVVHVGSQEASNDHHIIAPDDERVWRYDDASISHPREPVYAVLVKGPYIDEPGIETDVGQWADWANPLNDKGSGDVRVTGIARRTDIDHGLTFVKDNTDVDMLRIQSVAARALQQEIRDQNTGTVSIDPIKSGDFTDIRDLDIGDFVHLVPDDNFFDDIDSETGRIGDEPEDNYDSQICGSIPNNEIYTVEGITQSVRGAGNWTIDIDVAMLPDDPVIGADTVIYDPHSDEYQDSLGGPKLFEDN